VATVSDEPAFTAARRVRTNGWLWRTDLSPEMLSLAREEAADWGCETSSSGDGREAPDLPAQSFDAALCRWTLMFLPHLITALTRLRELLVPEGRFAAAVWGSPEKVAVHECSHGGDQACPTARRTARGHPRNIQSCRRTCAGALVHAGGFAEVAIERQTLTFEYPSLEKFIEERPATSASIRIMLAEASAVQRETILAGSRRSDW